jgi:hypothetical protein
MSAQEHVAALARQMIELHGLRAAAVAEERAHEAQLSGKTEDLDRWHSVQAAIGELRRTQHQGGARTTH